MNEIVRQGMKRKDIVIMCPRLMYIITCILYPDTGSIMETSVSRPKKIYIITISYDM